MALNEKQEAGLLELLAAYENGKRIADLEPAQGEPGAMRIEVMDGSGETRSIELERAVAEAGNPIAGRWWDNTTATPTAGGVWGSVEALRNLPATLGLGRYLVTDDGEMRKLDPRDSRLFADGSPAALDGSMGQCMWCWSRPWYFTEIVTAERTYWGITMKPIEGRKSYRIPAGGTSWLGVGVMDRTELKLCSLISDDERYRGGEGKEVYANLSLRPGADTAQATQLGMAATGINTTDFGTYARKRGEGWEANWYVAQAAVEILFTVIMGTRDSQAAYNTEKDADGLYQGGFGAGVTGLTSNNGWSNYNDYNPVIPTCVGVEMGDGTGLVEYGLPASATAENQEEPYKTFKVPCFLGLMFAGYGHLWRFVRGLTVSHEAGVRTEVYAARSMSEGYTPGSTSGMMKVAECPQREGYIKRLSTEGLCMMPTEVGGSASTYYTDDLSTQGGYRTEMCVPMTGRSTRDGVSAGVFAVSLNRSATLKDVSTTAPLCFFVEDPIVEF